MAGTASDTFPSSCWLVCALSLAWIALAWQKPFVEPFSPGASQWQISNGKWNASRGKYLNLPGIASIAAEAVRNKEILAIHPSVDSALGIVFACIFWAISLRLPRRKRGMPPASYAVLLATAPRPRPSNPPRTDSGNGQIPHVDSLVGTYKIRTSQDGNRQTIHWSTEMYRILGRGAGSCPRSIAEYATTYIHPEDQGKVRAIMEKALAENGKAESEYRIVTQDGTIRYVCDIMEFAAGESSGNEYHGQLRDITERKRVEAEHIEATAKFQVFAEQLGGMPYIANLNSSASLLYVSPRLEQLLGFATEEWSRDSELRIRQLHPDDRNTVLEAISANIQAKSGYTIEYRVITRDGNIRWLHDEAHVIFSPDGVPLFFQGVAIDITERKRAQAELDRSHHDLQRMIAELDSLREEEQKRLAKEMHDDLGQLLAAMKIDLSRLQQRLPQSDTHLLQQLSNINELVDAMVTSVRRIIADLPPKMLADLGLFSALDALVSNFRQRHQLQVLLDVPDQHPIIDNKIATPIYRIVQESLNNVAKHAKATRVTVRIACANNFLVVHIADNGAGMPIDLPKNPDSFGLIGMRERTKALGGEFEIDSIPGKGTTIQVTIPLHE